MSLDHTVEWGAFLDGEAVGGEMLHLEAEGGADVALPVVEGFAWEAVNQIDADILNTCLAQMADGFADLLRRMATAEKAKASVVEGLGTHGDAVDGELL